MSSRNFEAALAASELSPVVIVRCLCFKHGLSGGVADDDGVSSRWMNGLVELGRAIIGRTGCGEAIIHGELDLKGAKSFPPPDSGNETLGIFGVGG